MLILDGRHFVKHTGVRSAIHQHLVHEGLLSEEIGAAYNALMAIRQEADYEETGTWTPAKAQSALESATRIVDTLRGLLPSELA